jgi:hypothetical protein
MNRNCPKCGSSNIRTGSGVGFEHLIACNDGCAGWFEPKDTGCEACDKLPGLAMCLKHQLEEADYMAKWWMNRVEELKQKQEQERNQT